MGSTSGDGSGPPDVEGLEALLGRPAAEWPATRWALRKSRVLVVLFMLSAVGLLVLGGGLRWRQYQLTSLATTGVRVTGTVESVDSHIVARERHLIGFINVTFPVDGQAHPVRFDVSNHVVQYHGGDQVEVAYDPQDPDRVDLVNDAAASQGFLPWEIPTAFALMAGSLAAIAIRHLRTYRKLLRGHEWLAVPSVLKPTTRRVRGRGTTVAELGEPSSPERVVASGVGIRALPPTVEPVAWVAGWGERRFVMAPPGGRPLLLMHRVSEMGVDADPQRPGGEAPLAPGDPTVVEPHQRHAP